MDGDSLERRLAAAIQRGERSSITLVDLEKQFPELAEINIAKKNILTATLMNMDAGMQTQMLDAIRSLKLQNDKDDRLERVRDLINDLAKSQDSGDM